VQPGVAAKEGGRRILAHPPLQAGTVPEHFRRIREAYDQVRSSSFFYFRRIFPNPSPSFQNPSPRGPGGRPFDAPAPSGSFAGPRRTIWSSLGTSVQEGQEHEVYQQLLACHVRLGNQDDVLLRLYWLLRAVPGLDLGAIRALVALGLRQNWNGPCRELYHREVEQRPAEAVGERFTALLESPVPLAVLADWLEWRWSAAGALDHWQVIADDVTAMRSRFSAKMILPGRGFSWLPWTNWPGLAREAPWCESRKFAGSLKS